MYVHLQDIVLGREGRSSLPVKGLSKVKCDIFLVDNN
jgi:hypothetical protein